MTVLFVFRVSRLNSRRLYQQASFGLTQPPQAAIPLPEIV
jgi:hypothetical protein